MSQWKNKGYGGGGSRAKHKECKNPMFEQWLTEWREDAVQKNSKMQYVYSKVTDSARTPPKNFRQIKKCKVFLGFLTCGVGQAIQSIQKYPLLLTSGRECLMLEFIGPSIAKMIDKRMEDENISPPNSEADNLSQLVGPQEDPYKKPAKKRQKKANAKDSSQDDEEPADDAAQPVKKPKRGAKEYIPAFRSGPYALLVALGLKERHGGYRGYVTKSELMQEAQAHCEASMTRSENPSTNYTAWNGMSGLIKKNLILQRGSPSQYTLTPEGRILAAKLLQAENGGLALPAPFDADNSDEDTDSQSESVPVVLTHHRTVLEPGRFEVVLYVDTSETTAKCKKEEVIGELRKNGVSHEVVKLSVGDFVWVCRKIVTANPERNRLTIARNAELVLPYIVERKRTDDLASSIKDGRFHEQKFRLQQTGMKPIYLIENYGSGDYGLGPGALGQAVANTQMSNSFLIQETASIKDTCAYLTHMTRTLSKMYEGKRVSSCTKEEWPTLKDESSTTDIYLMLFSDLNDFGVKTKNWTVSEMFARHLMRLRGLSVERAFAIIQKYPTFQSLLMAYKDCNSDKEREGLLSGIYFGTSGRTIGPSISRNLSRLYNYPRLP